MAYKKKGTIVADQFKTIGQSATINSQAVEVLHRDDAGSALLCRGTVTVTDAGAGYAKGCLYIKTDGSVATTLYVNEGSSSSCDFNPIESSASTITGIVASSGLTGDATEGTATLAVGAGRGVAVRANAVDVGVDIYNNTGGTLTVGTLVNLSSFTGTDGVVVTKADADAGVQATHVVLDAINNTTAGVVYPVGTAVGVNTAGRTIGDLVYLDATTAGGFVFAALTGADQLSQVVGVVKVVDAAVGEIVFFPGAQRILKLPTTMLQDLAISTGKIAANAVTLAKFERSDAAGKFPIGQGGASDTQYNAMSGDATMDGSGALTIAAGAVTNAKVADSAGVGALGIRKSATVLYDFAVDGGAQGTIVLTGSPTIPDNAVVWVESYDVLTTATSGGADAATIALQLPTDGPLTTAIAISDGSNPWDAGVFSRIAGGLATPLTVKTTAARVPSLLVAGGNDLTAGKIVFQLAYWVSQ